MRAAEAAAERNRQTRILIQRADEGHDLLHDILIVGLLPIGAPLAVVRAEPAFAVDRIDCHEPNHAPVQPAHKRFHYARRFIRIRKPLSRREGEHGRAACPIRPNSHFLLQAFTVPTIHSRFHIHPSSSLSR